MTRMASDQVPDVFTHFPLDASFREQVKAGYMMDLTGEKMLDNVADDILDISLIEFDPGILKHAGRLLQQRFI